MVCESPGNPVVDWVGALVVEVVCGGGVGLGVGTAFSIGPFPKSLSSDGKKKSKFCRFLRRTPSVKHKHKTTTKKISSSVIYNFFIHYKLLTSYRYDLVHCLVTCRLYC